MKLLSLVPIVLGFVLAGCTSEASSSAANAANNAAGAASNMASAAAGKMLDQVKTSLAGITNVDTAKAAATTLTPMLGKVAESLKAVTGAWPADLTKMADGVREQVTRLSGMADVKGALGGMLEQITNMLPKK